MELRETIVFNPNVPNIRAMYGEIRRRLPSALPVRIELVVKADDWPAIVLTAEIPEPVRRADIAAAKYHLRETAKAVDDAIREIKARARDLYFLCRMMLPEPDEQVFGCELKPLIRAALKEKE